MGNKGYSKKIIFPIILFFILLIITITLILISKNNIKESEKVNIYESNNKENIIPEVNTDGGKNYCDIKSLEFGGKIFEDSIVLYVPFHNDTKDQSKNRNSASCITTTCPTKNPDNNSRIDGYTFDGNDYLQYNGLMGKPEDFTLVAFGNLNSSGKDGAELISIGDYASIRLDNNGNVSGNYHYNGGWLSTSYPFTYAGKGWHQFVYVFKNREFQELYIDSTLVSKTNYSKTIYYSGLSSMSTFIGKNGNGNTNFDFDGSIDEVIIFDKALSDSEIENLYSCYH